MSMVNRAHQILRNLDVDESGDTGVTVPCSMHGFVAYNKNAAALYLKFYDTSGAPTVGTDTPVITVGIPTGVTIYPSDPDGILFKSGIGLGATTGVADNNTGAPGTNDLVLNIFYS